jgi:hypothetical protein
MRRWLVVLMALLITATVATAAWTDSADGLGTRPDGTVDISRLPDSLPMVDCAGHVVGRRANPLAAETNSRYIPPSAPGTCDSSGIRIVSGP